jgi:hypothetical protein
VILDITIPNVKGFIVNEETDKFAVGDIDDGLPRLRVAVSALCIGQRAQLVDGVQVGAREAMWLSLIKITS